MPVKNIIVTSSINSLPTLSYGQKTYIPSTDYQSFPIVKVVGEYGLPYRFGITQSFSESINTPTGRVNIINDTGYEFIDGQFKGSALLVTDGELSEDNPFLKPNNVLSNYITVLYFDDTVSFGAPGPAITPQSNFLNPNTSPNPGEIYLSIVQRNYNVGGVLTPQYRVEYLKIATIDSNGNDNVPSLQGLEDIFIQYSNGTTRQYNITNITPGPDYYLFKVTTTTAYTSIDSRRLNYNISASNLLQLNYGPLDSSVIPYLNIPTPINPLGYLDINTGIYTLGDTPNLQLDFTASTTISSATSATVSGFLYLMEYPSLTPTPIGEQFNSIASPYNILITGSFTPIEGQSYALVFANFTIGHTASLNNTQFNITQSSIVFPTSGAQDLVIFSPYLSQNFFYNDWNALYGNADGLEFDQNFMKVLYDTGQSIPTNQEEIISGSAERAPVKPYYYSLKAQTLPRYEGVRTLQYNENKWTEGDIGFGKEPSVKTTQTYFIYFNQSYDTSPLLKDKIGFDIKYLIDENGEVYTPSLVTNEYYNLIDSFETNKKAYVSLLTGISTPLGDPKPIKLSGVNYKPILYSISSSNPLIWTDKIDFVNFDGTSGSGAPNFNSIISPSANSINIKNLGSYTNISLAYTPIGVGAEGSLQGSSGYQTQGNWLDQLGSNTIIGVDNIQKFKFTTTPQSKIKLTLSFYASNGNSSDFVFYAGFKLNGATFINGPTMNVIPDETDKYYSFSYENYFSFNDEVEFFLRKLSNVSQFSNVISGVKFTINTSNLTIAPATSSFWFTGSHPCNVLTSSTTIGEAYGQYLQKSIPNLDITNVNEIFTIEPNDEFRFEYSEDPNNIFTVTNVLATGSGSTIYVTLDKYLPTSSISTFDVNHFTIRRLEKNSDIVLDTNYTPVNFGFLFPEYPSDKINNNLQNIIKNLTEKGLL